MEQFDLPFVGIPTFCKFPAADPNKLKRLTPHRRPRAAVLGVPFDLGTQLRPGARYGPRGIRDMSTHYSGACLFDYDIGRDPFPTGGFAVVDCGDADMVHYDADECLRRARQVVRQIVEAGVMPIVLGGDHSITIPVLQAFEGAAPFTVVQIDTHLDFVDSKAGVTQGQGSPMRRASEMAHVASLAQIGIHGAGSSTREDFEAARLRGSVIIGAREWRRVGTHGVVDRIPRSDRYYVTVDIDVLDGALAPGTGSPELGGMTYLDVSDLLVGIAGLGDVVGFDLVEVSPPFDPAGITSLTAARLILDFLGAIARRS